MNNNTMKKTDFCLEQDERFLVLGGGNSSDFFSRLINKMPWYEDECIWEDEQNEILNLLKLMQPRQSFCVLSHMLPWSVFLEKCYNPAGPSVEIFLERIFRLHGKHIKKWYAAHYHKDISFMSENTEFEVLYQETRQICT